MDILTQGLIGATMAQSVSRDRRQPGTNRFIRKATLIGFLTGMLADADVFIRSSTDPLLVLEYHRHFTHALLFVPFGALIASALFWPFFKQALHYRRLYLTCFAGYLFSGVIDTCTSYGTRLFWPFSNERIAWHLISIIDPVFSVALLAAVLSGVFLKRRRFSIVAILFAVTYLAFGYMQQQRAESVIQALVESRGHHIERNLVKPTLGNLVLWRSIYEYDNRFYVDVIRVGAKVKHYDGDSVDKFILREALPALPENSVLANAIKRFTHFSDGYVSVCPGKPGVIGDIRYSMAPRQVKPLWGITIDPTQPDKQITYDFYRESTKASRKQFMDMLLNR